MQIIQQLLLQLSLKDVAGFYTDQSLVPHQSKNLEQKQKIAEGIKLSLHTTG